jgi:hypothetical protein
LMISMIILMKTTKNFWNHPGGGVPASPFPASFFALEHLRNETTLYTLT